MAETVETVLITHSSMKIADLVAAAVTAYVKEGLNGCEFDVEALTNRGNFTVHFEIAVRGVDVTKAVN